MICATSIRPGCPRRQTKSNSTSATSGTCSPSGGPWGDYIFHAAALKQVPSCEFFPMEIVRTNVIGICHGEKMYETLLTNEECAKAIDMGDFYCVPADNRGLNYDKYFKDGDEKRNTLTE